MAFTDFGIENIKIYKDDPTRAKPRYQPACAASGLRRMATKHHAPINTIRTYSVELK
jgi:hypothetical protein